MQAAILPFRAGWMWIRQGVQLFLRQPLALLGWGMTTTMLIMASYLIFPFGPLILIAATPALTFITLNACRHLMGGSTMRLGLWLAPLGSARMRVRMLQLGLAYLAACLAGGFLAVVPFVAQIAAVVGADGVPDPTALSHAVLGPLVLFFVFYVLISALFWHAPALMGWHDLGLARALFFSMVACWRNKGPFLLYGLTWGVLLFAVQWLPVQMFDAAASPVLAQWFFTLAQILLITLLYCSFYPSYVSVFGARANPHAHLSASAA